MHEVPLLGSPRAPRRVLLIGAHADDIEIGCGATVLSLVREHPEIDVTWVVLGASGVRELEARASAEAFLGGAANVEIVVHAFRDGFFPYIGAEVKELFESLKARVAPDVIFTHTREDLHQDHRVACELTWNTWRNHLIFEYEVPKYDGDLSSPNVFVPVTAELVDAKIEKLTEAFPSQRGKHWFDAELFRGLMRIRGMEAASPTGYAEAYVCRKLSLTVA